MRLRDRQNITLLMINQLFFVVVVVVVVCLFVFNFKKFCNSILLPIWICILCILNLLHWFWYLWPQKWHRLDQQSTWTLSSFPVTKEKYRNWEHLFQSFSGLFVFYSTIFCLFANITHVNCQPLYNMQE